MNYVMIGIFVILALFSLFEFVYCTWLDRREGRAAREARSKNERN